MLLIIANPSMGIEGQGEKHLKLQMSLEYHMWKIMPTIFFTYVHTWQILCEVFMLEYMTIYTVPIWNG